MRHSNRPSPVTALGFGVALLLVAGGYFAAQAATVAVVKNNNFGVGEIFDTTNPTSDVHVKRGGADILVEDTSASGSDKLPFKIVGNDKTRFFIHNKKAGVNSQWSFDVDNGKNFNISLVGSGVNEMQVKPGGNVSITGTLTQGSSVELKRDLAAVEGRDVLDRVMDLRIMGWTYKTDADGTRHMGPMAEDFRALFGLGADEKHLAPSDVAGVALAAIQGLNDKVDRLESDKAELQAELARLRELVETLAGNAAR